MTAAALLTQRHEGQSVGLAAITQVLLASVWAGFLRLSLGRYVVLLSGNVLRNGQLLRNRSRTSRRLKLSAPGGL